MHYRGYQTQPACQPASLPASQPACLPASQPACLPASQPACLPASRKTALSVWASKLGFHVVYRFIDSALVGIVFEYLSYFRIKILVEWDFMVHV